MYLLKDDAVLVASNVLNSIKEKVGATDEGIENPFICIAGGFIRDALLGKPIKDIDVFCDLSDDEIELIKESGVHLDNLSNEDYGDGKKVFVASIKDFLPDCPFNMDVNIIVDNYAILDDVFNDFDIGLCKVAVYDNQIYYTNDFWNDANNKVLSVYKKPTGNHLKRLQVKYDDFGTLLLYQENKPVFDPNSFIKMYNAYYKTNMIPYEDEIL